MSRGRSLIDRDWLRRAGHVLGLIVLVGVVLAAVVSSVPGLVGADESYVVRSDSMSPAIPAGSVVFVEDVPTERISTGDVITFETGTDAAATRVTHRVVAVQADGERQFRTKGDANPVRDREPVAADQVVGAVSASLPLIGYLLAFASTDIGLLAFVVVPGLVLVALEVRDVLRPETASDEEPPEAREP